MSALFKSKSAIGRICPTRLLGAGISLYQPQGGPKQRDKAYDILANTMWKPGPETIEGYGAALAARRDSRYLEYPYQVCFETLSLCNATCEFCPYPSLSRRGSAMSDELIDKIL